MSQAAQPRSLAGPILLLIVLLADVGLIVLAWHMRQQRRAEYGNSGLDFSAPPKPAQPQLPSAKAPPAAPSPNPGEPAVIFGTLSSVVPESLGPGPRASSGPAPAAQASVLRQAKSVFERLKAEPRFRGSKILREWKRDFLAYPDLAAINSRYRKDGNVASFLKSMVRSGNFRRMLAKYIGTPDMQSFLKELSRKPEVLAAAKPLCADNELQSALRRARIPGVPSFQELEGIGRANSGQGPRSGKDSRVQENAALRNILQEQGLSGDTLRNAETGRR